MYPLAVTAEHARNAGSAEIDVQNSNLQTQLLVSIRQRITSNWKQYSELLQKFEV